MTLCRLILPDYAQHENPSLSKVLEGQFTEQQIKEYNGKGYNIYYLPNGPDNYSDGIILDGSHITSFNWVFVDCDLKDGAYPSKDAFIEKVCRHDLPPTKIVDSGNGVHVYWKVQNLDAMSYLRFQRRLTRLFDTDEAVGKIFQLMRLPGTINTKIKGAWAPCEELYSADTEYTAEELNSLLPPITNADDNFCKHHYDMTYNREAVHTPVSTVIPPKFGQLLRANPEVKSLWADTNDDRSVADFRLGHIMFANGFSKEEAASVLVQTAKAMQRAPHHRISYAQNIIDKIWTFELSEDKEAIANLSPTVREILSRGEETIKGTRFPCNKLIDDTVHGFRLGQVIGIIAGSGVGKTTLTLNAFLWFAENNPDYHHFFFSLEQPVGEIASRIRTICNGNDALYDKIHIVSNYSEDGTYRHFSLEEIENHVNNWQKETNKKAGAVVIDHIGVLDKSIKNGEADGLIGVCRKMKAVAVSMNVMLIMLSQAPREKCGVGDIELDKSAAYGTVFFESFCDYCICLWQPLKRVYFQGAPTTMAIKFVKIRHKLQNRDNIKEDVCYQFFFDPNTERIRELTQDEETSCKFWVNQATNLRKLDKKTDIVSYQSRRTEEVTNAEKTGTTNQSAIWTSSSSAKIQ